MCSNTRSNVQVHAYQCMSTREPTKAVQKIHASVHRYMSNWTNVSRALPARQARERQTRKSGTHASGKYYCLHTRAWPTGTVTADTVLNTASKSFCCFIWRRCLASTPCRCLHGSILGMSINFNLPLETIPFFPSRQLHIL